MENISRRQFLKTTGLGALALTTSGLMAFAGGIEYGSSRNELERYFPKENNKYFQKTNECELTKEFKNAIPSIKNKGIKSSSIQTYNVKPIYGDSQDTALVMGVFDFNEENEKMKNFILDSKVPFRCVKDNRFAIEIYYKDNQEISQQLDCLRLNNVFKFLKEYYSESNTIVLPLPLIDTGFINTKNEFLSEVDGWIQNCQ